MVQIFRFHRLLTLESEIAPQKLQTVAVRIANRLGLKTVPTIHTTSAYLSPLVWWIGGKVRIVIPTVLLEQMDTQQFEWVMAHELAHVRRRDYLVRWIEWLACVCFWWNPLVWWARHHLRANEEICCDALVVSSLKPEPHSYANSLLTAIEYLVRPVLRPPAIASEIDSGGFLERRFKMIMSENLQRKNVRWLQVCVLLLAAVVLPLSLAYAQDCNDKTEAYLNQVWTKLQAEVEAGNMSAEDAEAKMIAIEKRCAIRAKTNAYFEQVWEMLQAEVEAGSLTAEDAETMMTAVKKKYAGKAKYRAIEARIRAAVEAGEISEEDAEKRLVAARKDIFEDKRAAGIEGHFNRLGVDVEAFGRIQRHLHENGVAREQLDEVMGGMLRVVHEMRTEGEDLELDPRMQAYFDEIGLTGEQIDFVVMLAQRIAAGRR